MQHRGEGVLDYTFFQKKKKKKLQGNCNYILFSCLFKEQTRRDRETELQKKKDKDDQMAPMRMGMKIMTDASILLSGGKESENHDPHFDNNNGSLKFDNKFSFRINKRFNAPFSDDADNRLNHKYGSNNSTLGGPCNTPLSSMRSLAYNGSNKWRDSMNSNNLLGVTSDL